MVGEDDEHVLYARLLIEAEPAAARQRGNLTGLHIVVARFIGEQELGFALTGLAHYIKIAGGAGLYRYAKALAVIERPRVGDLMWSLRRIVFVEQHNARRDLAGVASSGLGGIAEAGCQQNTAG